ncbi:MAG: PD-(D/E)XK nuclease family protein, partial [Desulfarculaceae bacterium]
LLQLPLEGYPRTGLAQVLDSPYFAPSAFARKSGQAISAAEHLARAGYVDAREGWSEEWLNREIGGQKPEKRSWTDIAQACQKIKQKVDKYSHHNNIIDYIELILGEIDSLGLGHLRKVQADWPGPALGPGPAHLQARDLKAMDQLRGVLTSLQAAARQVEAHEPLSPGRLLSLVRETLAQKELRLPSGPRPGLRVLRVEQAAGLRLHTVLAGGLNQGQLPARPQGRHLLSGGERLALGRLAGLPVWRTDDEEYAGQQLRLYGLISQAGQGAVLAYAAHDSQGREQKPAFLLKELATSHDEKLGTPQGGVFGALPPLVQAREPLALWGGLAQALLGTGADPESAPLAQAALWHLVQSDQEQGQRWSDLAQRSLLENSRQELDLLPGPERSLKSGPFSGCLGSDPALDVLGRVLSHPSQRRLSPSSLETYAACPQAWFFSRILGLEAWPIPAWDLERSREGEWVHATLKMFFNPEDFQINAQAGAVSRRLQDCLQEAREQLLASAASGHAAIWEARQPVLFQALSRVVSREMKDLAQTPVRAVEMEFGPEGAELRVLVKEGEPLVLQGRLDRLDLGQGMLRVTDYKHTTQDQNLRNLAKKEAQAKYAFQLPMYLAAARRMMADQAQPLSQLIGRLVPTALTHLKAFELELNPDDDLLAQDKEQRRRLAQDGRINLFNAVAGIWQRITKGDFTAQPEPGTCSYCQFSPLCRAQVSPGITGDRNEG